MGEVDAEERGLCSEGSRGVDLPKVDDGRPVDREIRRAFCDGGRERCDEAEHGRAQGPLRPFGWPLHGLRATVECGELADAARSAVHGGRAVLVQVVLGVEVGDGRVE